MKSNIDIIKGVHPGFILERELKKRKLGKGRFAISINEYPQTLVSIMKGKRNMNAGLSLRVEKALDFPEGYFMVLQAYYEVEQEKLRLDNRIPDLTKIRPALFWDSDINKIKWEKYKNFIIKRAFERGDDEEKKEIIRFYGLDVVNEILKKHD